MRIMFPTNNNFVLMINQNMLGQDSYTHYPRVSTIATTSIPNQNFTTKPNFNISTLNCRGLRKSSNITLRSHFIYYLRTLSLDLLALQETHASSISLQQIFHTQFQASDSLWSQHCGLVCFSPDLSLSNSSISICGRLITTTVS